MQKTPAQETPAQEPVTLEDNAFVEPVLIEEPAAEPVAENVTVALAKPEHVKLVLKKDGSWMLKWDAVEMRRLPAGEGQHWITSFLSWKASVRFLQGTQGGCPV